MDTLHEGEIIIKEKYASLARERYYVKPPEQSNVVTYDETGHSHVVNWFTKVFLPQGYPDSVSKDYMPYQYWDTAQAFCSTIAGILATQEVLRGVGVGDTNATPLAATITWVLKDGCGHVGRIVFAFSHGTYLDAYSKKWRLYADTLNDAAMFIEIALPYFRNYTTVALCISTVMKAIVGVAGGATRVAMTQHHAIRGNMADVSAKDSAQETAVNLVASLTALFMLTLFGNSIFLFSIMVFLHISFNYFAVRAVCLKTLNEPRFLQVIDRYLKKEVIAAPCDINLTEPIIFYQLGANLLALKIAGFHIKMGNSIDKVVKKNSKAAYLKNIKDVYEGRNYVIVPDVGPKKMYVLLREGASTDDMLCAYFHAVLLSIVTRAINEDLLSYSEGEDGDTKPFTKVCRTLQAAEWSREPLEADAFGGYPYGPSVPLMSYVDKIVNKEWYRVRDGLRHTGWDLSKHLLIVDEWRLCSEKLPVKLISLDKLFGSTSLMNQTSQTPFSEIPDDMDYEITGDFTIEPDDVVESLQDGNLSYKAKTSPSSAPMPTKVLSATEVKPETVNLGKD